MDMLFRCRAGDAMNRFKNKFGNWQVLEEKVVGGGVLRVMINDKSEISKFYFWSGEDTTGYSVDLVFFCGRVDNQMVLF